MDILITGIGSVSPYGTLTGPIAPRTLDPRPITAWPAPSTHPAYLVEPFRPTDVVPGLKTRRLDRLSVWSLVAAALAIRDASLDLVQIDLSRVAVVFGSGLGCLELTEAFFRSGASHGWAATGSDSVPETLGNAPAGHIARCFGLRGPNLAVSRKGASGECALTQAVSLLKNGQAGRALVLAGDTLTQGSYKWYEAAGMLSRGFIPSEGVAAVVLDTDASSTGYAKLAAGDAADARAIPPDPIAAGLPESGALLGLAVALSTAPQGSLLAFDRLSWGVSR